MLQRFYELNWVNITAFTLIFMVVSFIVAIFSNIRFLNI